MADLHEGKLSNGLESNTPEAITRLAVSFVSYLTPYLGSKIITVIS